MLNYLILFTTIIVGITEAGILETIPLQQQSEQLIGLRKIYYENRPIIGYETEILKPDLRPFAEPLRVINQARLINPGGSIQLVQSTLEPQQQRYRLQQQDNLERSSSAAGAATATAIASSQGGATAYGNAIQRYSSEIPQYASSAASAAASASSVALSRSDNTAQDLYNLRDPRLQQAINEDYLISANQYGAYLNNNNGLQNYEN